MKRLKTKQDCSGCDSNFYNGNNSMGVKECWLYKDAKLKHKFAIGWWVSQGEPSNFYKTLKLNCYTETGRVDYLDKLPTHLG